jgi:hypothetical protein
VPVQLSDGLPTQANFVDIARSNLGKIKARFNRQLGKSGIMFGATDALLGHREEKLPVADDARGRVVHLGIVQAKSYHARASGCLRP